MGFESIVCPECRATEGFTEVGPGTYYCPYHKGLFEHVDPSLITVRHEGIFCSCGNRVEFQCQLCRRGLCGRCDVAKWKRDIGWRLIIPVQRSGYLELVPRLREHQAVAWHAITDNRIVPLRPVESGFIGPFVYPEDIYQQINIAPDNLRHVCCSCVSAGAAAATKAIVDCRICEHPACGVAAADRCLCCSNAFCRIHIGNSIALCAPVPGLCMMCAYERSMENRGKHAGGDGTSRDGIRRLRGRRKDNTGQRGAPTYACVRDQHFDNLASQFANLLVEGTDFYWGRAYSDESRYGPYLYKIQ
jgi:hypothetical protein